MRQNWWRGIHRGGEVTSSSGLGNPTPTHTASVAHLPIFVPPVFRLTCRPSGALGYLVHVACYKHAAPLGLKQAPVPLLPDGLGDPTPTGLQLRLPTFQFLCLPYSGSHVAPLGLNGHNWCAVSAVGERFSCPAGWGTQPLRIQLRLLTFQFSCLPVHMSPLWGFGIFGACRLL